MNKLKQLMNSSFKKQPNQLKTFDNSFINQTTIALTNVTSNLRLSRPISGLLPVHLHLFQSNRKGNRIIAKEYSGITKFKRRIKFDS